MLHYTSEQIEQAYDIYNKLGIHSAAIYLKCSIETLYGIFKMHGYRVYYKMDDKLYHKKREKALELYYQYLKLQSLSKAAEVFSLTKQDLSSQFKHYGLPVRTKRGLVQIDVLKLSPILEELKGLGYYTEPFEKGQDGTNRT